LALNRLAKIDPYRAKKLSQWASTFFSEADIGNFALVPIDDSKHKIYCPGCKVLQMVNQQEPQFPGDKRYLIAQQLWKRMDNDNQATTILHEITYREAMADGQTDSTKARYFNSQVFSGNVAHMSLSQYYHVVNDSGLCDDGPYAEEYFYAHGFLYTCDSQHFAINDQNVVTFGFPDRAEEFTVLGGQKIMADPRQAIQLWDNGAPRDFAPVIGTVLNAYGYTLKIDNGDTSDGVFFDQQGNLIKTSLTGYHWLKTSLGKREFVGEVIFNTDGSIKAGYMWSNSDRVKMASGQVVVLKGLNQVQFNVAGALESEDHWSDERLK
jgi:hypothetical protein